MNESLALFFLGASSSTDTESHPTPMLAFVLPLVLLVLCGSALKRPHGNRMTLLRVTAVPNQEDNHV